MEENTCVKEVEKKQNMIVKMEKVICNFVKNN